MRRTSSDEVDNEINRINEDTRKSITSISKSILSLPRNPSGSLKNQSDDKPKSPYSAFTHQIRKIVPEEMALKWVVAVKNVNIVIQTGQWKIWL